LRPQRPLRQLPPVDPLRPLGPLGQLNLLKAPGPMIWTDSSKLFYLLNMNCNSNMTFEIMTYFIVIDFIEIFYASLDTILVHRLGVELDLNASRIQPPIQKNRSVVAVCNWIISSHPIIISAITWVSPYLHSGWKNSWYRKPLTR